jgi:hypothetical protein
VNLEAWWRRGSRVVTFTDGDGQEHVVCLSPEVPAEYAREIAEGKLRAWRDEGRAVFTDPLSFVSVD